MHAFAFVHLLAHLRPTCVRVVGAQVDTRLALMGPWLDHACKSRKVIDSEAWQKFVQLKPNYAEIEEELNTKVRKQNEF
jgi:hypothetical protein